MTDTDKLKAAFEGYLERATTTQFWLNKSGAIPAHQHQKITRNLKLVMDTATDVCNQLLGVHAGHYYETKDIDEYQISLRSCKDYFDIIDQVITKFVQNNDADIVKKVYMAEHDCLLEKVKTIEADLVDKVKILQGQLTNAKTALADAEMRWRARGIK